MLNLHNTFTEEDKKNFVDFLNVVAMKAEFKMNTGDIITYFKLLTQMQRTLLPKIEANIFEFIKHTPAPEEKDVKKRNKVATSS